MYFLSCFSMDCLDASHDTCRDPTYRIPFLSNPSMSVSLRAQGALEKLQLRTKKEPLEPLLSTHLFSFVIPGNPQNFSLPGTHSGLVMPSPWGPQKTIREIDSLKCKSNVYWVHITSKQGSRQCSLIKKWNPLPF